MDSLSEGRVDLFSIGIILSMTPKVGLDPLLRVIDKSHERKFGMS